MIKNLPSHVHSFRFTDGTFLRTLASSLIDFNELSSIAALNMLLEVQLFFFFYIYISPMCFNVQPAGGALAKFLVAYLNVQHSPFKTTNRLSFSRNLLYSAPLCCLWIIVELNKLK